MVKTIRTVTKIIEQDEDVPFEPKFSIGDYLKIYYGRYENHCFTVDDIRWNYNYSCFEYHYGGMLMGDWMLEDQVVYA